MSGQQPIHRPADKPGRQSQRQMSMSPRRFAVREAFKENSPKNTKDSSNSLNCHFEQYNQNQRAKSESVNGNYFAMNQAEKKLKYIEHMEYEFDMLMKHKQQLDAQLTRLPYKATNSTMHNLRESVETELDMVEKKLSSVKLELRKLNIIKSH